MKAAIPLILIILCACSCTPARFSYWGELGDTLSPYYELGDEKGLQETSDLQRERSRAQIADQRAKLGLQRHVKCTRCYRDVPLPVTARKGDQVRCGSCGKNFAIE